MHIKNLYDDFTLSFEFIPPRNGVGIHKVYEAAQRFMKYRPGFFTVTQSSPPSLRGGNEAIAAELKRRFKIETMSHMICAQKNAHEIENNLMLNYYLGVKNIMALRGDPPWGQDEFRAKKDGFRYAYQLVEEIQRKNQGKYYLRSNDKNFFDIDQDAAFRTGIKTNFCVGVAGYPETHRECDDPKLNIEYLKKKVDAGADVVFTQMFYKAEYFKRFVKECRNAGIHVPIIPGIMPITFWGQVNFIKDKCAVEIPKDYLGCLGKYRKNKKQFRECSVRYMTKLCTELQDYGVKGMHFYTLNNYRTVCRILDNVDLG